MQNIDQATIVPVVGMGATIVYPQDNYPAVVVRVSKSGKTAWLKRLRTVDGTTGHEPARYDGPFPIYDHVYTDQERQDLLLDHSQEQRVSLRKNGRWAAGETPVRMGEARYYRNFSY